MKKLVSIFSASLLLCLTAKAQYYLRGEIRNEKGINLPNVRITLHTKGNYPFFSGSSGVFGIPSSSFIDTIYLYLDGYEILKQAVETPKYQYLVMKQKAASASIARQKLASITKDLKRSESGISFSSGESYSRLVENDYIIAEQYPETGFALNINRASYSNIRRFINNELKVPPDAVRIDEMLNYFNFNKAKNNTKEFICSTNISSCPWNNKKQLFFINLHAPKLSLDDIPPTNLVFLIDVSGSMDRDNRLPLVQSAFKLLVNNLREKDTVSIVVYGGDVGVALYPTSGAEKKKIITAIDDLGAGGATPGEAAIRMAYSLAQRSFIKNGNNRVILATDGDFNVGQQKEQELEELVFESRKTGIYLTCLGVGMGNYKDSKLEALAKKGNGNLAYLDNIHEAEKVLIQEFTKTLFSVANDAFLNVKFNHELVKEYRLIGFDNKIDAVQDSTSEFEGGEVGSGHSLMAVFEITPTQKLLHDTLLKEEIAQLKLQYKLPKQEKQDKYQYQHFTANNNYLHLNETDSSLRFAASVIMFGSMLKQSKFCQPYGWETVIAYAENAIDKKVRIQREFIDLLKKGELIYVGPTKKKNKKKNKKKKDQDV